MAQKTATIPITDHASAGCTAYYLVRYKASSRSDWTTLTPNPIASPIIINGLAPSTVYNLGITRYCCDGIVSATQATTFTTSE